MKTKTKYKFWSSVITLSIFCLIVAIMGHNSVSRATENMLSPIAKSPAPRIVYAEQTSITGYIKQIFGNYSDKALAIANCESNMNPTAIGDSGKSIGLFQIHTTWHKIEPRFLKNFKINTLVAKQLFDESGKSFRLWSCSRELNK